jgi:hypothetical protein
MAGVDPLDLNPMGAEVIGVTGFAGGIVPLRERLPVKNPGQTLEPCNRI